MLKCLWSLFSRLRTLHFCSFCFYVHLTRCALYVKHKVPYPMTTAECLCSTARISWFQTISEVQRKRVVAAPYSRIVDSIRSLYKQQQIVVIDYICVPVVMFRRNCQKAVFFLRELASQPLLLYTAFWTFMLAATVTVAALSLEMGFSTAISPHMEIAEACALQSNKASPSCRQCFRLPLDGPRVGLCVPANMFKKSGMDLAVPPVFAPL